MNKKKIDIQQIARKFLYLIELLNIIYTEPLSIFVLDKVIYQTFVQAAFRSTFIQTITLDWGTQETNC